MSTVDILAEIRGAHRQKRDHNRIVALAQRVNPSEWVTVVPQLDPAEIAVLLQWLPDARYPRTACRTGPVRRGRDLAHPRATGGRRIARSHGPG